MKTAPGLLTAEEFRLLPDDGVPRELVRGKVVEMTLPPESRRCRERIAERLRPHVYTAGPLALPHYQQTNKQHLGHTFYETPNRRSRKQP